MAKSYYEGDESVITKAGLEPIKASDLQKKFDAVTEAEYDKQRTELQNTENKFYNKLYDTQQTTMDTIRQNNASAVATGASKGIQAANELSALLGLQQESVEGATDIANRATTIAQDETQAMLENVLNAEQQSREANQALANILVQAASVDVEGENADTAKQQVQLQWQQLIEQVRQTNPSLAEGLQSAYNEYYGTGNTDNSTTTMAPKNLDASDKGDPLFWDSALTAGTAEGTPISKEQTIARASFLQELLVYNNVRNDNNRFYSLQNLQNVPNGTVVDLEKMPEDRRNAYLKSVPEFASMKKLVHIDGKWFKYE